MSDNVNLKDYDAGMFLNITPATSLIPKLVNVEVLAVCGYAMARKYADIDSTQSNIFSTLQNKEVANDVRAYTYLIFKHPSGTEDVIADAWIENIAVVEGLRATVNAKFETMDDLNKLRLYLESRGIEHEIIMR